MDTHIISLREHKTIRKHLTALSEHYGGAFPAVTGNVDYLGDLLFACCSFLQRDLERQRQAVIKILESSSIEDVKKVVEGLQN